MSNELILAVVLTIVLVADLIVRSFKKKDKIDDSLKIGKETSKKYRFNFNYFINRKRNIITFIILGLILKPAIHYQFFTELEDYINTDKKLPAPKKRKEFLKLSNINHNVVKVYTNLFYDEESDYFDLETNKFVYVYKPIKEFSKNYYLKTDEFDLNRLSTRERFNIIGNVAESKINHWEVKYLNNLFIYYSFQSQISAEGNIYETRLNIPNYKDNFFFMYNTNFMIDICIPFSNSKETDIEYFDNGKVMWFVKSEKMENIPSRDEAYILYVENKKNGTIFKNFEYIEKEDFEPITKLDTIKGYEEMMESGMYMDYKTKLLYDTLGNQVVTEKDGKMVNFFIHPQELRKSDFNFHFDNIFKLKLWIFLISFSFLELIVFLFNDKIQAR